MDEDSILFQAMRDEMSPAYQGVDQAAMFRSVDPNSPYPLGVDVRTKMGGGGGGLANPARMARPPNDFTGRPMQSNDNPAYMGRNPAPLYTDKPVRPDQNVINQYQQQWQNTRMGNMARQEQERAMKEAISSGDPNVIRRTLESVRNFFNANRPVDPNKPKGPLDWLFD